MFLALCDTTKQQLKHQQVINIIVLLNSKHSIIAATMKKVKAKAAAMNGGMRGE